MDIVTIIVALVLAFIAWKVLMGVIKFGAIALIAVAAIFLGGMRPLGVGVASLVFGFFAALSIRLGNADIPSQLVQAIPYLATLVGLGLFAWRESQRRQQFAVTEASRWDRLKRWRRGLTRV